MGAIACVERASQSARFLAEYMVSNILSAMKAVTSALPAYPLLCGARVLALGCRVRMMKIWFAALPYAVLNSVMCTQPFFLSPTIGTRKQ